MKIYGYDIEIIEYKGMFTMYCKGTKGGAIISDVNRDECIRKFKEALALAIAVDKLMHFKETGTWKH